VVGRRLAAEVAATDAAAPLALHAAALELLATVGRAPEGPKPSAWLDEVADHLHDRLFERVTLAELAAVAGVHRAHLVRVFRARYGVSVGTYVRRERIEWAARALRSSDTPIVEIALQAGFADQSHFTRTFAKHMGVSPGLYRRSAER
jgi:AraC family transcriptional regulator